jgi:hypothetical protein
MEKAALLLMEVLPQDEVGKDFDYRQNDKYYHRK